jgi:indolepyruvate ferredoxin oxidoreductase beta subunit
VSTWTRILFAGVGGQGVLSAGRWVGDTAHGCDLPVVVGQIHGLSQRGGSVHASVAIGGARDPEIPDGRADVLVALEPMEGARALPKVSKRTVALVNTRPILPASLQSTGRPYPPLSALLDPLGEAAGSLIAVDATTLATAAGSARCLNVAMLGMLAGAALLPFPGDRLLDTIEANALPGFAEVNRTAFRSGEKAIKEREVETR